MHRRTLIKGFAACGILSISGLLPLDSKLFAMETGQLNVWSVSKGGFIMVDKVIKTEQEWRQQLTDVQYHITRDKGTEPAFSGAYAKHKENGVYQCVCCGQDLFSSETKYDSGTGWPSYYEPVAKENVATEEDSSWFMVRTEVHCSRCDGHLGHIFADGPKPTGQRYCINSASLKFTKA